MSRPDNRGRRYRDGNKKAKKDKETEQPQAAVRRAARMSAEPAPKTRKGARAIGGLPTGFRRRLT